MNILYQNMKCCIHRVIELFAKKNHLSLDESLNLFYHSKVYDLISEGISDMHCMSDDYLVQELEMEYNFF